MGKAEKIVVLGVLFLIVLILSISLQTGSLETGGRTGAGGEVLAAQGDVLAAPGDSPAAELDPSSRPASEALPREPESRQAGVAGPAAGAPEVPARREAPATSALLNAGVRPAPIYEVPETIPDDWALRTLAALADHRFDPSLKVYTIKDGDTFESLAERYYGGAAFAALLRRNNEGVRELAAGRQLLVPVHDDGLGNEESYEVVQDDSLWRIAKKVYGQGHRWGEIWEANRDVLPSPDDLKPGMTLRIP